jgi:hypothetical protein
MRDHEDFADLHDLVMAVGGHHPGILVMRFDNDPRHNLTEQTTAERAGTTSGSSCSIMLIEFKPPRGV